MRISHVDMLRWSKSSEMDGIFEMVADGEFGYVYCGSSDDCPSLVCQYVGYM